MFLQTTSLLSEMNNIVNIINLVNVLGAAAALAQPPGRQPVRRRVRLQPFDLPDREFKARYRFSKDGVSRLVDILRPHLKHRDNRGSPFSPEQIVCCGLGSTLKKYYQKHNFNVRQLTGGGGW